MKKTITTPSAGESVTEAEVHTFLVAEGAFVKENDPIIELETDKATAEVYAPATGTAHFSVTIGQTVHPGDPLGHIETDAKTPAFIASPQAEPTPPPLVPKIVSSSEKIRIPIEEALKKEEPTSVSSSHQRAERREKMSKLRRTIAHRLVEAKNTTAMLTTFNEVDMSAVIEIRKKEKESFEKAFGVRLGFMSFFVKATALSLKQFPTINAFIDGDEFIYHDDVNMGVAVGTDRGLVVPVIREAQKKSFAEIEKAIADFAKKAKEGKLKMSDMEGGTFTISNGGTYGSLLSTPILNMPQSGILGMHAIKERPVVIDGKIEIRPMMYLALSYDHRVVDGESSIKFLVAIKDYLENPEKFFIME
jgi:2-oxoglutarate dehydrogenase E2 component (dihydrolipoamide succinyltransferase)